MPSLLRASLSFAVSLPVIAVLCLCLAHHRPRAALQFPAMLCLGIAYLIYSSPYHSLAVAFHSLSTLFNALALRLLSGRLRRAAVLRLAVPSLIGAVRCASQPPRFVACRCYAIPSPVRSFPCFALACLIYAMPSRVISLPVLAFAPPIIAAARRIIAGLFPVLAAPVLAMPLHRISTLINALAMLYTSPLCRRMSLPLGALPLLSRSIRRQSTPSHCFAITATPRHC